MMKETRQLRRAWMWKYTSKVRQTNKGGVFLMSKYSKKLSAIENFFGILKSKMHLL